MSERERGRERGRRCVGRNQIGIQKMSVRWKFRKCCGYVLTIWSKEGYLMNFYLLSVLFGLI
jgi:hypothetical protein